MESGSSGSIFLVNPGKTLQVRFDEFFFSANMIVWVSFNNKEGDIMNKSSRFVIALLVLMMVSFVGVSWAQVPEGWEKISNPGLGSMEPDGLEPGGDVHNSYAWCQAILDGYVYVGSNRDMLSALGTLGMPTDPSMTPPPSPDTRARIFRYKMDGSEDWEIAYLEDPIFESGDMKVGHDFGYRGMEVFQASGDLNPALYVVNYPTPVPEPLPPCYPRVLKIPAGYDPATDEPAEVLRLSEGSLRSTTVHQERLFVGNANLDIWASSNPQSIDISSPDKWTEGWIKVADLNDFPAYNPDYFNNPTIPGIWDMISFNGYIYAFLGEPMGASDTIGFLVYKGHPVNTCPGSEEWEWDIIVGPGGKYGPGMGYDLNYGATPIIFKDHVYVGTFTNHPSWMLKLFGGNPDIIEFLNSAAPPQIYRFDDDDNWEMIIGDPHPVNVGGLGEMLILPTGNYSGGFYHPLPVLFPPYLDIDASKLKTFNFSFNSYIWEFGVLEGKLYCTTFDQRKGMERVFEFMLGENPEIAQVLGYIIEFLNHNPGGFDMYVSEDGKSWDAVTRDGFHDPFNYGGRSISTFPGGMFVGTSNPSYGCQMWEYSPLVSPPCPLPEMATFKGACDGLNYELSWLPCSGNDNGKIQLELTEPDFEINSFLKNERDVSKGKFFKIKILDDSLNGICKIHLCLNGLSDSQRWSMSDLWWTFGDGWESLPLEWHQLEGKWSACVEIPLESINALFGISSEEGIFSEEEEPSPNEEASASSSSGGGCSVGGFSSAILLLIAPIAVLLRKRF